MELDRQAFKIDFNLSKRTAILGSRCTSGGWPGCLARDLGHPRENEDAL